MCSLTMDSNSDVEFVKFESTAEGLPDEPVVGLVATKRPSSDVSPGIQRKKKRKKSAKADGRIDDDPTKNALMRLNELCPGLEYTVVSQSGPVHNPVFCIEVQFKGLVRE